MTRQSIKKYQILFLFLTSVTFAQSISKIEISGNKLFSENNYLNWIKISSGSKYFVGIEDSVRARISAGLRDEGYFHYNISEVKSEKIDSTKSVLRIAVSEGTHTTIEKIHYNSGLKDSLRISNIISELVGAVLTRSNVESVFSEVLDYYENRGFPFASIKIESIEFTTDSTSHDNYANISLFINEGTKSKIDKIEVAGNTKTKDYVITRTLRLESGEEYSQKEIDEIPDKLNRLRFFEPVTSPEYYINSKNEGVVKISVKEKETNYFDGIIGYVPATTDKQKGYLTGFININLRNLFGTGRAALFRWQQESQSSQELEISYLEPWLFGYPFNIEAGLFQRKQDSTYVQRNINAQLEYIATPEISASLLVNSQSTIPTERTTSAFTVYNSTSLSTGVNLKVDTRDDSYAPTSGLLFINSYKYTSKKINGPAEFITSDVQTNITFQHLEFDFSIFKQIFSKQVLALGVHARELRGSNFEVSDLYYMGGTNSLRGYLERQFLGNRVIWTNLEYRYLMTRRTYAFAFFDTGYYLRNGDASKNISEISAFKTGYGFGLNLETGLGILGVSFALGKGDSFSQGKIHFGIINEF
jgi:outer membrane protein insertion porin family